MMRRPTSVPRAARYSLADEWWQIGEVRDGRPYGTWRTFRTDGSRLFEAEFDAKGRLDGRYVRFHPDGAIAREATYARGVPVTITFRRGPGDVFPSSDPRAQSVVVKYKQGAEKTRRVLDGEGVELEEAPPTEAEAIDVTVKTTPLGRLDAVFATAEPDDFLASDVLPRVFGALDPAPPVATDPLLLPRATPALARRAIDARRFQDLYGVPPAPVVRAWLDATATGESPALLGFAIARDNDLAVDGNLIEALIVEHQDAPGDAAGLRALVSGLLPIGRHGRLAYCVSLCEASSGDAPTDAVYPIAVASDVVQKPVARTLDDFAYAVALVSAADAELVSPTCLSRAYERLRGRIDLRPPMTKIEARALSDEEDDETTGDEEGDHREGFHFRRANPPPAYFFFRNRWLLRLLCGHAEGAAADFDIKYDGALDDTRYAAIKTHLKEPWVAFYWLFRTLVFGDDRLAELLAIASDSPSQLVRDTAALVGELQRGRRQLGSVADFHAVVREFLARDPMSNKSPSEDAESAAKPPLDIPPELAAEAAVLEWARAEGYSRENLLMDDEADVAGLGLAVRGDPRIVPYIVKIVDEDARLGFRLLDPWLAGDRANVAALVPDARRWLADESAGVHAWELAAKILARAGSPDDAAALAAVLAPSLDAMFSRAQGFASQMGHMELEEALGPMLDAMVALGVPDSLVPSLEGVCTSDNHLVDDARGPCALALAALGRGLDAIVGGLRGQIDREHAHAVTSGQLLAIGALGKDESAERRAELAALVEGLDPNDADATLARLCALADLRGGELADAARAILADDHYDPGKTRRLLIQNVFARRPDLPADAVVPYVHDADIELHDAAVRFLRTRGLEVPAFTLYDPFYIAQLSREQLHAGLRDDRALYRSNIALWLGDHPDPSAVGPLIEFVMQIIQRPDDSEFPDDGPEHYQLRWAVRALLEIGGADTFLDGLLRSNDRNVAEPVLRYADRLTPTVARGMVHVYETDEHWKHTVARKWILKHGADPAVVAALAEHELTVADVKRKKEDD